MSALSGNILGLVQSNLQDPHELLSTLKNFRVESVVLAIRVAVENADLARAIIDVARAIELCLESPLITTMQEHDIHKSYFTLDAAGSDVNTYQKCVVPELEEALETVERKLGYTKDHLQTLYTEAQTHSTQSSVARALDQGELEGCLAASHLMVGNLSHRVERICKASNCMGQFTLPALPTFRHYMVGGCVRLKEDEDWLPAAPSPSPRKIITQSHRSKRRSPDVEVFEDDMLESEASMRQTADAI